jgi:hypothetical protein
MLARPHARSTTKIRSKNSLYPHRHFTEHLVGAFRKPPRECNLNCKTSRFSIRQLKNKTGLHLQQSTQEYIAWDRKSIDVKQGHEQLSGRTKISGADSHLRITTGAHKWKTKLCAWGRDWIEEQTMSLDQRMRTKSHEG